MADDKKVPEGARAFLEAQRMSGRRGSIGGVDMVATKNVVEQLKRKEEKVKHQKSRARRSDAEVSFQFEKCFY